MPEKVISLLNDIIGYVSHKPTCKEQEIPPTKKCSCGLYKLWNDIVNFIVKNS